MKRVLVTGANGFVCSNIVMSLLRAGYRVVAVDRAFDAPLLDRLAGQAVEFVVSDSAQLPALSMDFAIHGAAITAEPGQGETPESHFRANVLPALAMLDWARDQGVQRLICISSSAVFRASPSAVLTEDTPAAPEGLYSIEKHAVELLVRTLNSGYKRDVISVRLGNIYGEYERSRESRPRVSLVAQLIHAALHARHVVVPHASPAVDWTYAGDIGSALIALLEAPKLQHDLYHVTSGQAWTALDIARALLKLVPDAALEVDSSAELPFRGALVSRRLPAETTFSAWTGLDSGMRQTVAWFREQMERVA
jgi:nucleoside-diphosphate-sugar epimerase